MNAFPFQYWASIGIGTAINCEPFEFASFRRPNLTLVTDPSVLPLHAPPHAPAVAAFIPSGASTAPSASLTWMPNCRLSNGPSAFAARLNFAALVFTLNTPLDHEPEAAVTR